MSSSMCVHVIAVIGNSLAIRTSGATADSRQEMVEYQCGSDHSAPGSGEW